jgi:glycosyltransferase involved in cell wall biosynthesis
MTCLLTVLIPCKNEAANILPCIASVRGLADEILIADSGSTDATLSLVAKAGSCRVIQREFVDSGDFKNWAIPQARHPWVLVVDADERVTESLAQEIRRVLSSEPPRDGYWIPRSNHFMGHRLRHTSWARDKVIRLFQRDRARYQLHTDHAEIDLPAERLGSLREPLIHFTCWDYDTYLQKIGRYTEQQAELWFRQGRRPSLFRLVANGPLRFLRCYVLHAGFLDGRAGFQVAALTGFYSFLKQAKLWQKCAGLQPPQVEGGGEATVKPPSANRSEHNQRERPAPHDTRQWSVRPSVPQ